MVDTGNQGPLNMGSGMPTQFIDFAKLAIEVYNRITGYHYNPEFKFDLTKPRGVSYRTCDPCRFNQMYTPTVTLKTGIERAIRSLLPGV
jgi:nucleoside-diphosphate-sugar epimerase